MVFTFMAWFIAIGAVIILGAVVGHTWLIRKAAPASAESGRADEPSGDATSGASSRYEPPPSAHAGNLPQHTAP